MQDETLNISFTHKISPLALNKPQKIGSRGFTCSQEQIFSISLLHSWSFRFLTMPYLIMSEKNYIQLTNLESAMYLFYLFCFMFICNLFYSPLESFRHLIHTSCDSDSSSSLGMPPILGCHVFFLHFDSKKKAMVGKTAANLIAKEASLKESIWQWHFLIKLTLGGWTRRGR